MTEPAGPTRGVHTVRCEVCAAAAYISDSEPHPNPAARLREFADQQCPRAGVGCPHTTAALAAREELRSRPRIGAVTALTATRAVVTVDGIAVAATRGADALAVGNTVIVQRADGQWLVLGRTL